MNKEDMQQVSADELLSQLSGSSDFGEDELVEMFAYQDDQNKDFCIYHRLKAFCVPLDKIREFFTRHAKPVPPMSKDQELVYLREKVKKLQDEVEQSQAEGQLAKPAPDEPEALVEGTEEDTKIAEPEKPSPVIKSNIPVPEEKPIPPHRDESIPPPEMREKMTLKETRTMLAKELKDAPLPKKKVTDSAKPKDILRAPKE